MSTTAPPTTYVVYKPLGSAYYLLDGALQFVPLASCGDPDWDESGEVDWERAYETDEELEAVRRIEQGLAVIASAGGRQGRPPASRP